MAKKSRQEDRKLDYNEELRLLKEKGPDRLYLLWGPEDYLREHYLKTLRSVCLPEGEESFSYKRMDGPGLDLNELRQAVDSLPFLTERSFVELRDVEINRLGDAEAFLGVLEEIPDYCTVVFVQNAQYEPDGRLKLVKGIRTIGRDLKFVQQSQDQMIKWIRRRFAAAGKSIGLEEIQRLIFISGDLMSRLIPEIDKVAAYAKEDKVTIDDVNAVAHHVPEAVIFEMTDFIAQKRFDAAVSVLAELLADKNNEPIPMLAMLGMQMRRLYAARLAADRGLGVKYVMDTCGIKHDFIANKLLSSARGFTPEQLRRAVELCAEADYKIKSSALDGRDLVQETVLRIAAGERDA